MNQLYAALIYCVGLCTAQTWHGLKVPAPPPPDGLILYANLAQCQADISAGYGDFTMSDGHKPPYQLVERCVRIYVDQKLWCTIIPSLMGPCAKDTP